MRASTILSNNNVNSFIDSEVLSKLLMCYYRNIYDNINKLYSYKKKEELNYIEDYINDNYKQETVLSRTTNTYIQKHKDVNFKKHNIIMNIFKDPSIKFCAIKNYIFPSEIYELNSRLTIPYITDKYILFYNYDKEILMVFTFIPMNFHLHNNKNYKSDILIRDLNCYTIDNVSNNVFTKYITDKVEGDLDYKKDIVNYNSISIKIGDTKVDKLKKVTLLRLVKEEIKSDGLNQEHPFYKWEILEKDNIYRTQSLNN
jgi:hypothetical protein